MRATLTQAEGAGSGTRARWSTPRRRAALLRPHEQPVSVRAGLIEDRDRRRTAAARRASRQAFRDPARCYAARNSTAGPFTLTNQNGRSTRTRRCSGGTVCEHPQPRWRRMIGIVETAPRRVTLPLAPTCSIGSVAGSWLRISANRRSASFGVAFSTVMLCHARMPKPIRQARQSQSDARTPDARIVARQEGIGCRPRVR